MSATQFEEEGDSIIAIPGGADSDLLEFYDCFCNSTYTDKRLIVDLCNVQGFSDVGLGKLITIHRILHRNGGHLVLRPPDILKKFL